MIYSRFSFTVDMITQNESGEEYRVPFEGRVDLRDDLGRVVEAGNVIASTVGTVGAKNVEPNQDGSFYVNDLPSGIYSVGLAPAGGSVSYSQDELKYIPHLGTDLLTLFLATVADSGDEIKDEAVKVSASLISAISGSDLKTVLGNISNYLDALKGSQVAIEDTEGNFDGSDVEAVLAELASSVGIPAISNYIDDSQEAEKGWSADKISGLLGTMDFAGENETIDISSYSNFTSVVNYLRSTIEYIRNSIKDGVVAVSKTKIASKAAEVTTNGTAGDSVTVLSDSIHISGADNAIKVNFQGKTGSGGVLRLYIDGDWVSSTNITTASYDDLALTYTIDKSDYGVGNHAIELKLSEEVLVDQTMYVRYVNVFKETVL